MCAVPCGGMGWFWRRIDFPVLVVPMELSNEAIDNIAQAVATKLNLSKNTHEPAHVFNGVGVRWQKNGCCGVHYQTHKFSLLDAIHAAAAANASYPSKIVAGKNMTVILSTLPQFITSSAEDYRNSMDRGGQIGTINTFAVDHDPALNADAINVGRVAVLAVDSL